MGLPPALVSKLLQGTNKPSSSIGGRGVISVVSNLLPGKVKQMVRYQLDKFAYKPQGEDYLLWNAVLRPEKQADGSTRLSKVLPSQNPEDSGQIALYEQVYMLAGLTSFMIDTAKCLHMGSRMGEGHGRLLYTATFFAFPRMYPGAKKRPFSPAPDTSPLQKLIMGL